MTHTALQDLMPCPFCGGSHASVIEDKAEANLVVCEDCISAGPPEQSEAEAIAAWNRRAALSAMEGEAVAPTFDANSTGVVAYMVPRILSFKGARYTSCPPEAQEALEGTVCWEPDFLGDGHGVVDKFGVEHKPRPLIYGDTAPPPQQATPPQRAYTSKSEMKRVETLKGNDPYATHPTPSPGPQGGGEDCTHGEWTDSANGKGYVCADCGEYMKDCEPDLIATPPQPEAQVSDAMVELALQTRAWREDGAIFPDNYGDEEVAQERYGMRLDLEAALSGRKPEPPKFTDGHCEHHKKPGGCPFHNLQCGWPECDRKPAALTTSGRDG